MNKNSLLPPICITATGSTAKQLFENARAALKLSGYVELRLDWLANPARAIPLIRDLVQYLPRRKRAAVVQATCRCEPNGGRFKGSVEEQIAILSKAADAGVDLVDLEIESAEAAGKEAVASLRERTKLILSWHDFNGT